MRVKISVLLCSLFLFFTSTSFTNVAHAQDEKEWTFLVFLNGNNNLDQFGTLNINQMEQIGSNDKINIVVQWGSYRARKVTRLLVRKDDDIRRVTSPVVQDLGSVDMGDWRNLADFIRWGAENYPAKHYFVDVWDHGSGWHALQARMRHQTLTGMSGGVFTPQDISWDDFTGNFMTTKQLGQAIADASRAIGRKIDIYGSDACLMAMAEVAGEMKDTVRYFVGSQDLEPGAGWPYDTILRRWSDTPNATAKQVATILVEEYVKSYQGGTNGTQEVTQSAFDLEKMGEFQDAIASLGADLSKLDATNRAKVALAANQTQKFTYYDYGDLIDFLGLLESAGVSGIQRQTYAQIRSATDRFVVANGVTQAWHRAHGVSIWLPYRKSDFSEYESKYAELEFQNKTGWSDALRYFLQDLDN